MYIYYGVGNVVSGRCILWFQNAQWLQFSEMRAVCLFASDIMLVKAKDTIFTMESFNPCLVPRIVPHGLIGLIRDKVKFHGVITARVNNVPGQCYHLSIAWGHPHKFKIDVI